MVQIHVCCWLKRESFKISLLNHVYSKTTEYESLRQQLYFHISENDATFINLTDHDRTLYLLRLDNYKTSHIIAKYTHLIFQKRKPFLGQKAN